MIPMRSSFYDVDDDFVLPVYSTDLGNVPDYEGVGATTNIMTGHSSLGYNAGANLDFTSEEIYHDHSVSQTLFDMDGEL